MEVHSSLPFFRKSRGLQEYVPVHLVIEADYQLVALKDSGSPQVSGRTEHQLDQISLFGFVLLQIVGDNFLALGRIEEFGLFYQLCGILFGHLGLASVILMLDGNAIRVEKLSSLLTARSAHATIHPIDIPGHTSLHQTATIYHSVTCLSYVGCQASNPFFC